MSFDHAELPHFGGVADRFPGGIAMHPDVHRPWEAWTEEQTLHLVVVYSNPFRWRTRREYLNDFIRHARQTANVRLYVVELAYGDRPWEVTEPGDPTQVQLRTDCELWHKENLIDIGVSRFPAGWKYGGYSDGDFHFTRHDWALEAIHMLQHHAFVQNFSTYSDLSPETATSYAGHRPYRMNSSFAWNYQHQSAFRQRKQKQQQADPYYGLPLLKDVFPFGFAPGAPGGSWSWTRAAYDAVGGMLNTCVIGSGDWHMAHGLVGSDSSRLETEHTGVAYTESIRNWQHHAKALDRNVGCVDNFAVHYFHGSHRNRAYGDRWQILVKHGFNPGRDLRKDWQGVWRWAEGTGRLRDDVRRYFIERFEDHPGDFLPGKAPTLV